jgi:hypothetical protein
VALHQVVDVLVMLTRFENQGVYGSSTDQAVKAVVCSFDSCEVSLLAYLLQVFKSDSGASKMAEAIARHAPHCLFSFVHLRARLVVTDRAFSLLVLVLAAVKAEVEVSRQTEVAIGHRQLLSNILWAVVVFRVA